MIRVCCRCRRRWSQHKGRLCRTCHRIATGDKRTTFQRGAEIVARDATPTAPVALFRSYRTRIIDGRAYDVVWDGTV